MNPYNDVTKILCIRRSHNIIEKDCTWLMQVCGNNHLSVSVLTWVNENVQKTAFTFYYISYHLYTHLFANTIVQVLQGYNIIKKDTRSSQRRINITYASMYSCCTPTWFNFYNFLNTFLCKANFLWLKWLSDKLD